MSVVIETLAPDPVATAARPLIVGIGGTTRDGSTSERALCAALAAAARAGAETVALKGQDIMLPMYAPGVAERNPAAMHFIDLVRRCDGLVIASPGYHGSVSGLIKNALDYVEDLRGDARPYLQDRAVGCIVCAAGWQAVGTTLTALRAIVHALRGWPTPVGAGFNTMETGFDPVATFSEDQPGLQLELLGRQVAQFAHMRRRHEAAEAIQS